MTAKEYLSQAFWIDRGITSKLEQIDSLNALATKATTTFSEVPFSGTRNVHKTEDVIIKIIDLENRIKDDMKHLVDLKAEIVHTINCIDSAEQRTILEKRYLCFLPWEDVAADTNYSIQHVFRLHGQALKEIDEIIKMRVNESECDTDPMI